MNYLLRLDDASEYMDRDKWLQMENLLDRYHIKPLVGVIPCNQDPSLVERYEQDLNFWDTVARWQKKEWVIALHGCDHRYVTKDGGINPVNAKSEFAGLSYEDQVQKVEKGVNVLRKYNIEPKVFFAPSHTFDDNTIQALLDCSNIRIISDTVANRSYQRRGMTFVPQQSGSVRRLPFHTVTFCYHPNTMDEDAFVQLENFLKTYGEHFGEFPLNQVKRKRNLFDYLLSELYFLIRKLR